MKRLSRRLFLGGLAAPAFVRAQSQRPRVEWGVQSGDVTANSAMVWSRTDRSAQVWVEWSTKADFQGAVRLPGPSALDVTGHTARVGLEDLPPGADIFYRAWFVNHADGRTQSEPLAGRLRTAPSDRRSVQFVWSGDTVGQGYGINPEWGGMRCYETMRAASPDFFIHSGDTIYADGIVESQIRLPDGTFWKNEVSEAKSHVANSLEDFRGCYLYNLGDRNVRRFNSEVAQIWQWDDHEVMNNWSSSKNLTQDARYQDKSIALLAARANRAFMEFAPMRPSSSDASRVYRKIAYGPLLDVFVIDLRSYRGGNSFNRQAAESSETDFFGPMQFRWLEAGLKASTARWKVIASDMPIGLLVPDGNDPEGRPMFEAFANGDGPPLGRELELARLLSSLKQARIQNVVWLTADVHYTAAHHYDPARARFTEFNPFWEFVSGPLNAGTFGPNQLDDTFGPRVVFQKHPPSGQNNLPPSAGMQFFGHVAIDGKTAEMTVTLRDVGGAVLFRQSIAPARR